MKKNFLLVTLFCLLTTFAFAQSSSEAIVLKGDIIDTMCADAHKGDLAGFVATHTKECALACVASGYELYTDGKLMKFDAASNAKIEEFLKKEDSKLQVSVTVQKTGETLNLLSIENQ
ncbi:MAG: hypothetical protein WC695_11525 [Candidatus Omnitrophota bacterium]